MFIISGLIGSGKSTIVNLFKIKGYKVILSDDIAKEIINTDKILQQKLINTFNDRILLDNKISLSKLRDILIESKINKSLIDAIVHPVFFKTLNNIISNNNTDYLVIELPLLETCNQISHDFETIVVTTSRDIRLSRYLKNINNNKDTFDKINLLQKSQAYYEKNCDYLISNNGTIEELNNKFNKLYRDL